MKKVYIDANIFIDFLDEQRAMNDINLHEKAVSLFKNLISKNIKIITSEDILCRSEERRVGKECRSRWSPYH